MVHSSPSFRRHMARGEAPHHSLTAPRTAIGLNKIRVSDFYYFEQGLSAPVRFVWQPEGQSH
jgi:hypothetical protein